MFQDCSNLTCERDRLKAENAEMRMVLEIAAELYLNDGLIDRVRQLSRQQLEKQDGKPYEPQARALLTRWDKGE